MEVNEGHTHPLIGELEPIFSDLQANSTDEVPESVVIGAVSKLERIVEDEHDAFSYRQNLRAMGSLVNELADWINRKIKDLFCSPASTLGGIRVVKALLAVEYMDLTEMVNLFSSLLLSTVYSTTCRFTIAQEAAGTWGRLLEKRSSVTEGIAQRELVTALSRMSASTSLSPSKIESLGASPGYMQETDSTFLAPATTGVSERLEKSFEPALTHPTDGAPLTSPNVYPLSVSSGAPLKNTEELQSSGHYPACLVLQQIVLHAPAIADAKMGDLIERLWVAVLRGERRVRLAGSEAILHTLRLSYRGERENYYRYHHEILKDVLLEMEQVQPTGASTRDESSVTGMRESKTRSEPSDVTGAAVEGSLLLFHAVMASVTSSFPSSSQSHAASKSSSTLQESESEPSAGARRSLGSTHFSSPSSSFDHVDLSAEATQLVHKIQIRINDLFLQENLDPGTREVLHNVLPLLAKHDRQFFLRTTATRVRERCRQVFSTAEFPSNSELRSALFMLLSDLTLILPDFMFSMIQEIMGYIERSLENRESVALCAEAATCFATLAEMGPLAVRPYLRRVMVPLFSGPIDTHLARNVAKLCVAFPGLRSTCLSKTLYSASIQLEVERQGKSSSGGKSVVLPIFEALNSLDFTGYSALMFIRESLLPYVTDLEEDVRRAAIDLCFKLVLSGCVNSPCRKLESGVVIHCGREHIQLLQQIIQKLCHVAVADPSSDLRLQALQKFTITYDYSLALLDPKLLTPALFDKIHNSIAAVHLMGRISSINPGGTYPVLRLLLAQSLADIQYMPHASKSHEQALQVVSVLTEAAPGLLQPYLPGLLRDCAKRLTDRRLPPSLITAALCCAGKLSRHAVTQDDIQVVREMEPAVVYHLLDFLHPMKKHEAIRALGEMIRTTKDVNIFEMHESHRKALDALTSSLHGGLKERLVVRVDILRLLGIIGAIDPHRMKHITRPLRDAGTGVTTTVANGRSNFAALSFNKSMYPQHVIQTILETLKLPSLTVDESVCAIEVITQILLLTAEQHSLDTLFPYVSGILDTTLLHTSQHEAFRSKFLSLLTVTVEVLGPYIRPFAKSIIYEMINYLPAPQDTLQQILKLLLALRDTLREEFRGYLKKILPHTLHNIQVDLHAAPAVFRFYGKICPLLDNAMNIILPSVCDVASSSAAPAICREEAVKALAEFARQVPTLSRDAPRCIHCLCGVIKSVKPVLYSEFNSAGEEHGAKLLRLSIEALIQVAGNLGSDFTKYLPCVSFTLDAHRSTDKELVESALYWINACGQGHEVAMADLPKEESEAPKETAPFAKIEEPVLECLPPPQGRKSNDEWNSWMRRLSVWLLHRSPSPAHQLAEKLAVKHSAFAQKIFHSAFRVMYEYTGGRGKELALVRQVLDHTEDVPSEILQELLNLAEYMERVLMRSARIDRWESPQLRLLFDAENLMNCSERCHLYAKAVHYVELQFRDTTMNFERNLARGHVEKLPPGEWDRLLHLCEKSIYLFNLLGHRETAESILQYIEDNYYFMTGNQSSMQHIPDAQLFEKLQWWSKSQRAYYHLLQKEPDNVQHMVGYMRSLDNLGNYSGLLEAWETFATRVNRNSLGELAPFAAHAAWLLRRWDDMRVITEHMSKEGYTGKTALFYKAVVAVSQDQMVTAKELIQQCRRQLDSEASTLIAESYERAYEVLIRLQQLSELEEFILKDSKHRPASHWQELWEKRLGVMAYEGWAETITNHAIAIPEMMELPMWVRYVALARRHGDAYIANETLFRLHGNKSIEEALEGMTSQPLHPVLALASFQHLYDTEQQSYALRLLKEYIEKLSKPPFLVAQFGPELRGSFALCYSKLAYWLYKHWQRSLEASKGVSNVAGYTTGTLLGNGATSSAPEADIRATIIEHLKAAVRLDNQNGVIWHTWAKIHAAIAQSYTSTSDPPTEEMTMYHPIHVVLALEGYICSLRIMQELEDALGFLSLWLTYGDQAPANQMEKVEGAMLQVPTTVWLKVIPQIIARMQSDNPFVAESVYRLLDHVAEEHPQALLYALSVADASYYHLSSYAETSIPSVTPIAASSSISAALGGHPVDDTRPAGAAKRLLQSIGERQANGSSLVADAALVCNEVVRCAALWPEMWDDIWKVLDTCELSQLSEMLRVVVHPLMQLLRHPTTGWELHFSEELKDTLEKWYGQMCEVAASGDETEYRNMRNQTIQLRGRIDQSRQHLVKLRTLSLSTVSPALATCGKNLSLVIPGVYKPDVPCPCIACFDEKLEVLNTKQRPRRMHIGGTDGEWYQFLLKGHGDLRLDERVMQLLSCVNTLLEKHSATQQRDCSIQVYSVTPLSENAGLVGWVDHSETLSAIIEEYRHGKDNSSGIGLESKFISESAGEYPLRAIQRLEHFEAGLEVTPGTDLANSLWMRAPSAEVWLDRRTTYVCSLATMSMVGHVLGLGDRHPSNLMIHAFSGRVVHIDFGECFEAAQLRSIQPENVPFRLTRMLVKALELGGINGLFRHGSVTVMNVLRKEGGSILALLEAFVHDPLVFWWGNEMEEGNAEVDNGGRSWTERSRYSGVHERDKRALDSYVLQRARHRRLVSAATGVRDLAVHRGRETGTALYHPLQQADSAAKKAQRVVDRIKEKLEGREFHGGVGLHVESQVSRLIEEARSNENICCHYVGWCPFW